jgi:hypothetical protein
MAGAASAHQAATASREQTSQQRARRTRRTSADLQRAQQGATAAVDAPAALDSLSRLQQLADASPQVTQLRRLQALADGQFAPVAQLAGGPEEEELIQGKFATAQLQPQLQQAPHANNTGLPDQLKSGIESLSGLSMDHVRVHYNSSQPAQLNALAYAQGSDIHLAPGQERHLPHEAWHVVQQAQGRVKPTLQMAGGLAVNDDAGLEREADVMGGRAIAIHSAEVDSARKYKGMPKETTRWQIPQKATYLPNATMGVQQFALSKEKLNVAGEDHYESDKQRAGEQQFCNSEANGPYYLEQEFKGADGVPADDPLYQIRFVVATVIATRNAPETMWNQACELYSAIEKYGNINNGLLNTLVGEIKKLDFYTKLAKCSTAQIHILAGLLGNTTEHDQIKKDIGNPADQLEKIAKKYDINSYNNESEKRSDSMHLAATNAFNHKGVWKIGDFHVGHIKAKYENIKYNLIDEAAFRKEYEAWIRPALEESESQNKTTQVGSESEETMVSNPLYSSSADKKTQETTKGYRNARDLFKDD